jgi:NADPH-dependent 2,4-dienoyl-CoA reductase/sulfur reductase-like enzyme
MRARAVRRFEMGPYKYVIAGGGMAAAAAVKGIRETDGEGTIIILSADEDPPYKRPPLTKKLWFGKPLESVWIDVKGLGAEVHLQRPVAAIDRGARRVLDHRGAEFKYENLLIAAGVTPRRLSSPGAEHAIYFRSLSDYRRLRELTEQGERFAVIGGGFIGSEIAAALAINRKKVSLIFPGKAIGEHVYPSELALHLNDYYEEKGVRVLSGLSVTAIERRGHEFAVQFNGSDPAGNSEIFVDGVVAGIGVEPNVQLARECGLEVENGIVVDELLRTSDPKIYAAGDIALFHAPALDQRLRVEHEDNANMMGLIAGQNMAGAEKPYAHLPFFYSDLFDLGYEAVGELDSRLQTVSDWEEPFRKGVVYYMRDRKVRGVLLWNVWEQVDAARQLIAENREFAPDQLKGRLGEVTSHVS